MSKYTMIEIKTNFEEWDNFVLNSRLGTIFSLSSYLKNIGLPFKVFFVKKGNDIKAGFSFLVNQKNTQIIFDDLIIYNGIIFANNEKQKNTRARSERFLITEEIITFLDKHYKKIIFQLAPNFEDLRPFLWHNYHSQNQHEKFKIQLKYTSFLDIHDMFYKKPDIKNEVYFNLDSRRQADIQKARNNLSFVKNNIKTSTFIDFYKTTLLKQGEKSKIDYLNRKYTLIEETVKSGLLKKFATKNKNEEITYIVIFGIFKQTATYLFGAGDIELMERYDASFCLWESIKSLNHDYGISLIDMEGINSPKRGSFKLDFGGNISPYYQVVKE